mmetsp:Transcript_17883/g.62777  ORF Transcript_17883/g.62777 Transcript_17883/m.62777 type:complete len:106 (-) Transcript_17883:31-348(-)
MAEASSCAVDGESRQLEMWRWEQRRPLFETRTGAEHKVVQEACEGRASVAWLPFRAVGVEAQIVEWLEQRTLVGDSRLPTTSCRVLMPQRRVCVCDGIGWRLVLM